MWLPFFRDIFAIVCCCNSKQTYGYYVSLYIKIKSWVSHILLYNSKNRYLEFLNLSLQGLLSIKLNDDRLDTKWRFCIGISAESLKLQRKFKLINIKLSILPTFGKLNRLFRGMFFYIRYYLFIFIVTFCLLKNIHKSYVKCSYSLKNIRQVQILFT